MLPLESMVMQDSLPLNACSAGAARAAGRFDIASAEALTMAAAALLEKRMRTLSSKKLVRMKAIGF